MKLNNVQKYTNNLIRDFTNKNSYVVDATCGNGIDTEFLARRVKKVYAFDIQESALNNAKKRCEYFDNVVYINDGHENILNHVDVGLDLVIFNLGYLPGSDMKVVTKYDTTISSLKGCLMLLNTEGIIIITIYRGHDGGFESANLDVFFTSLASNEYAVLKYEFLNLNEGPFNVVIQKR